MTDGGYFAIKGFSYQFDKVVLSLLSAKKPLKEFTLENIQDINTDDYVIQVKYKETQKFTPSKIKTPVLQLIEEYEKDVNKEYILYCYFNDLNGYGHIITESNGVTLSGLNLILGKGSEINEDLKLAFIKKFTLDFSPTFQEQFTEVLKLIKNLPFVGQSNDEAILYYAQIIYHLTFLINSNPNPSDRKISQKQLLLKLEEGRKLIFNTSFQEFKSEEEYYKALKRRVPELKKNRNNLIIIGDTIDKTEKGLKVFIDNTLEKFYKNAKRDVQPFTLIIPNKYIEYVKKCLIRQEVAFNDGYEHILFNEKIFYTPPIKNRKTRSNGKATDSLKSISYKLRLLSLKTFTHIPLHLIQYQMIYYFDYNSLECFSDVESIYLEGLALENITKLL